MKPLADVARELGVPVSTARVYFYKWCRAMGVSHEDFIVVKFVKAKNRSGIVPKRIQYVPDEAVGWMRWRMGAKFPPGRTFSLKAKLKQRFGDVVTVTDLAAKYGINPRRVRREFKWWCVSRGYDPYDFYRPGLGYALPEEFIEWFGRVVKR